MRCDNSEKLLHSSNTSSIKALSNNVFTDEILYSTTITQLNLEILDQNDNSPVFTNPPQPNYHIAFPDSNLIELTMPKYLFKAEAYDVDEGINAEIQFSTSAPSTFDINSVTGEINPIRTLPNEALDFMIYATDRNGDGLITSTSMVVNKLTSEQVVEIVVTASTDLTQLIQKLTSETNLEVRILSSTQVPFISSNKLVATEPKIKIYAYAYNPDMVLLSAEEIIDQLRAVNLDFSIDYFLVDGCRVNEDVNNKSCDLTGWILAVSFTGTFIVLMLIAIPLIWIFWLKAKLSPSDSTQDPYKDDLFENACDSEGTSTPMAAAINENVSERARDAEIMGIEKQNAEGENNFFYHMIKNLFYFNIHTDLSDAERLNNKLLTLLEDDLPSNEKKYVSFNEMVQRIDVLVDTDETEVL